MSIFIIIIGILAVLSPISVALIISKGGRIKKEGDINEAESRIKAYEEQIKGLNHILLQQSEDMRRQAEEFRRVNEENQRQTKKEFENISLATINSQKRIMQEENRRQLSELLNPLRLRIEDFNKVVSESYIRENATRQSLADQIERLMKLNTSLSAETRNLTKALRGDSKVQGDWGETILETLLQHAGLKRDINYAVQVTADSSGRALRDEEGNLRRPDVVLYLPEGKSIIIDSKVSLTAYIDIVEAPDDESRIHATRRLIESVKKHVMELAEKKYQKLIKDSSEQILMFMPVEGAWITAVNYDPTLWDFAFRKNVVIVSPTHLFSVIQLIAQMWRTDMQNKNAAEIARLGGLIYDKIALFTKEFDNIHRGLETTEKAYQNCLRHLTTGSTSVMARTRKIRQLGAKATNKMSATMEEALNLNSDNPDVLKSTDNNILSGEPGSLEE